MALLKVLVSMILLVGVTLAEYRSLNPTWKGPFKRYGTYKSGVKPSYRLPDTIVPEHYDISLDFDLSKPEIRYRNFSYDGKVDILFSSKTKTNEIIFHLTNFIKLKSKELTYTSNGKEDTIKILSEGSVNRTYLYKLTLEKELDPKEKYHLKLEYEGKRSNYKGLYRGTYFDKEGKMKFYLATDFEPIGARNAFPCFDEPHLKATFSITIKYNKGYQAISNTIGETTVSNDFKTTVFKTTPKMSTYLVAYAITSFDSTEEGDVIVYSRPEAVNMAKDAAIIGNKVLKLMNEYTGINYNDTMEKIQQIALPYLGPTAMENWGLITYRETSLLYNKSVNKTIDEQRLASVISHEMAHQWFGDLVTPEWWKFLWLNEGFATYFEHLIPDKINPNWRFMEQFNIKVLHLALREDSNAEKTRPMDYDEQFEEEIPDLFDAISYDKGAAIVRMFNHVLGEKFQEGVRLYLESKKQSVANPEDLYEMLGKNVGKDVLPEKLSEIFKTWTTQPGYPVITVTKHRKDNKTSITVEQQPFYLVEPPKNFFKKNAWYVPLNYVQQKGNETFDSTSARLWLKSSGEKETIENVENDGWIIFNVKQTGYYRVNYDNELWEAIIQYLENDNFTTIDPMNRAQLIDDAFNLAHAGLLNYNVTLSLIKYLARETDYIVWKAAFNGLSKMNDLLGLSTFYDQFLIYLEPIFDSLLNSTGLMEKEEDEYLTKLLRVDAIKWACAFQSKICQDHVKKYVNNWLDTKPNTTFSQDLKGTILCAASRNFSENEWNRLYYKGLGISMASNERAEIFSSLGCTSNRTILNNFLSEFINPDYYFQKHINQIFQAIYANNPIGVRVSLEFLGQNIEKLIDYNPDFDEELYDYLEQLANRIVHNEDSMKLQNIITSLKIKDERFMGITERNQKWYLKNAATIEEFLKTNNAKPIVTTTTQKPNSASYLTFSIALITASFLLTIVQ